MKRNAFGEPILQEGDDILATFSETFDTSPPEIITAIDLEDDDNFGWSAVLQDENYNEIQVHDFKSEEELRSFLTSQGVEIR
jgi:hypothetical protein